MRSMKIQRKTRLLWALGWPIARPVDGRRSSSRDGEGVGHPSPERTPTNSRKRWSESHVPSEVRWTHEKAHERRGGDHPPKGTTSPEQGLDPKIARS